MKKSLIIVLLFVGCRPTEKLIERKVDIDSTVLVKLKRDVTKIEQKTISLEKQVLRELLIVKILS